MSIKLSLASDAGPLASHSAPEERIRAYFALALVDLFRLFNEKQDERGPGNVIRAGAQGLLAQLQERIERVRSGLARGKTSQEEMRANLLDIAGFGIILRLAYDGDWADEAGNLPSLEVSETQDSAPATGSASQIDLEALTERVNLLGERLTDLEARVEDEEVPF